MTKSASSDAVSQPSPAVRQSAPAAEGLAAHLPTHIQEYVEAYVQDCLKILEAQLVMERQRQRDQVEEELHKIHQHVGSTTQELRQLHQTLSTTVRETLEDIRKELSDALYRLSQDVDRALRQADERHRRAMEELREEVRQALATRDLMVAQSSLRSDPLPGSSSYAQPASEEERT